MPERVTVIILFVHSFVLPCCTTLLYCRSAEETKLSMHLKDSMREQCIAEVAAAWFNITQLYKASRPELAAFVLASAARYVHWMDISLVANDRWAQQQQSVQLLLLWLCVGAADAVLYSC
jgi:hypothetical protein